MKLVKCKCGNPDEIQMRQENGLILFGTKNSIQLRCWRCKQKLILTFKYL